MTILCRSGLFANCVPRTNSWSNKKLKPSSDKHFTRYFAAGVSFAIFAPIGMGAWWTLYVLTLHTVWSTSVAIALIEALVPNRRTTPWLGKVGLALTTILFLFGATIIGFGIYTQEVFLASPSQLIGTLIAIAALIVFAFKVRLSRRLQVTSKAPSPRVGGLVSLLASSLFMALSLVIDVVPGWVIVGIYLALYALIIKLVSEWSRSVG